MFSRPLVIQRLEAVHTSFRLDFVFDSNITIVMGDSGTGKSVVFSILQEEALYDERILCISYLDLNKGIERFLKEVSGKLIVVDNADVVLTDKLRKEIALDNRNQYLIMGRNPRNLLASKRNLFTLKSWKDDRGIRFSLEHYL